MLAAASDTGDMPTLERAAAHLGTDLSALAAAEAAGLVRLDAGLVEFRHPLARSAAYRSAPVQQIQEIHRALAEATDPAADPDRRAWHRAQAAAGPDEDVAAELERSAGRAQGRREAQRIAAFLERGDGKSVTQL